MGRFAGIENARPSEGGLFFEPGVYKVRIKACKSFETRKKHTAFIVECTVLESDNPKRPPGCEPSWVVTLDKEPALGNIKSFIAAATQSKVEEITEAVVEAVVAVANPLKGTVMRVIAQNIQTKEKKLDFTVLKWTFDSAAEAAA